MIEKLIELVKAVKGLHWYTIIALFVGSVLYSFNHEIVRLIEMEWSETDVVLESLDNDIAIDNALSELIEDTKSDRAYIFRFHNGVQYYNGTHKSKMSCDYEVVKRGVTREAQRLQDLPTALYSSWIRDVIENNMYVVDVSKMDNLRVRYSLEEQGIIALAVAPYYRNGKVFALIGVDYIRAISESEILDWKHDKLSKKLWFEMRTQEIGDLLI